MPTEKQIDQAISDFVMKIFLKERYIELKRQQLSDMDDFEPYVAYNRLVRNEYGGVTAKNIKRFLEDNSIIASQAKCEILVDQYNFTQSGILSYKEFLNIVLPREHPDLRAFVTQRECFNIGKDEYLSYDTEVKFSNLLDLEIHLYEELYEEKKILDLLGVKPNLILEFVNRKNKNVDNINFTNLKSYMEDCGINSYDSEIISFLRRVDINDDGIIEQCDLERFFKRFEPILKENNTNRRAIVGTSRELVRERSPCRKIVSTKISLVKSKKKKSVCKSRREKRMIMSVHNFNTNVNPNKENNVLNSARIVDSVEKHKKKLRMSKVGVKKQKQNKKEKNSEKKKIFESTPKKVVDIRGSQAYQRSVKRLRKSMRLSIRGGSTAKSKKQEPENKITIRESINMNLFSSKKNCHNSSIDVNSICKDSIGGSTKIMDANSSIEVDDVFNSISINDNIIPDEINVRDLEKQKIKDEEEIHKNENLNFNTNQHNEKISNSKGKSLVYTNSGVDYNSLEDYNIFKTDDINVDKIGEFSIQEKARRASIYINNEDPLIIHRAEVDNSKVLGITKNILHDSVASTSIGKSSVCGIEEFLGVNSIAVGELEKKVNNSEFCVFNEKLIEILKQERKIELLKMDLFKDEFCIEDVFKLIDIEEKGQFGFEDFREFVNRLEIKGAGTRNTIDFFGSFDIQQTCFLTIHEFSRMFYPQTQLPKNSNSQEDDKDGKDSLTSLDKVKKILQAQFNIRKMIIDLKQLVCDKKIDTNKLFGYFDEEDKGYTTKEEIFDFLNNIGDDVKMEEVELFISRCTYGEDIHELSFKEFYIFFSL